MSAEPIDEDNPIEAILLTGFPNPDRVGCPPPEVIEALGQRKIGRDDPAWRHIWNCSPCFKAFKVIRDGRLAEVERKQRKERRFRRSALFAAVGLLLCAGVISFLIRPRHRATSEVAVVAIDLTNAGTFRGSESLGTESALAELPRNLDELRITLPRFSRNGRYLVGILKSKSENAAIALGSATALTTEDSHGLVLVLKLDLSTAEAGRYFLATRLEEQGQESAAYYYPILIDSEPK